jgi:thioredoxin-like negative regulator of GroEL
VCQRQVPCRFVCVMHLAGIAAHKALPETILAQEQQYQRLVESLVDAKRHRSQAVANLHAKMSLADEVKGQRDFAWLQAQLRAATDAATVAVRTAETALVSDRSVPATEESVMELLNLTTRQSLLRMKVCDGVCVMVCVCVCV